MEQSSRHVRTWTPCPASPCCTTQGHVMRTHTIRGSLMLYVRRPILQTPSLQVKPRNSWEIIPLTFCFTLIKTHTMNMKFTGKKMIENYVSVYLMLQNTKFDSVFLTFSHVFSVWSGPWLAAGRERTHSIHVTWCSHVRSGFHTRWIGRGSRPAWWVTFWQRYAKRSLMSWGSVIPKEGRARPHDNDSGHYGSFA